MARSTQLVRWNFNTSQEILREEITGKFVREQEKRMNLDGIIDRWNCRQTEFEGIREIGGLPRSS
jgi:hypothetical protein